MTGSEKTRIHQTEKRSSFRICDLFSKNVPKVAKTTIEICLKVGNGCIITNI